MITARVKFDVDLEGIAAKLDDARLWTFAAAKWRELYAPFVPVDTGRLLNDVSVAPKTITHTAPYAVYVYNSGGGKNATGSAKWDMAAAGRVPELVSAVQAYIDGGGLRLGS